MTQQHIVLEDFCSGALRIVRPLTAEDFIIAPYEYRGKGECSYGITISMDSEVYDHLKELLARKGDADTIVPRMLRGKSDITSDLMGGRENPTRKLSARTYPNLKEVRKESTKEERLDQAFDEAKERWERNWTLEAALEAANQYLAELVQQINDERFQYFADFLFGGDDFLTRYNDELTDDEVSDLYRQLEEIKAMEEAIATLRKATWGVMRDVAMRAFVQAQYPEEVKAGIMSKYVPDKVFI